MYTIGSSQHEIVDSLELQLAKATDPKTRIDLLLDIGTAYQEYDYPRSLTSGYDALAQAEAIDYPKGIFYAYNLLGVGYNGIGPIDSAHYYHQMALAVAKYLQNPGCLAISKNNLGIYYLNQGNYVLGLQYFQEALAHDEELGDHLDPTSLYANIGIIHEELGDIPLAIEYYLKSSEAALAIGGKEDRAYAFLDLGYVAGLEEDYDLALQHYDSALVLYNELGFPHRIAETLYYQGEIHFAQKDYGEALQAQNKALVIYEDLGSIEDIPSMYGIIGKIHKAAEDNETAIQFYLQAIERAKEGSFSSLMPALYEELSDIYVKVNDYERAYGAMMKFQELQDSFLSEATQERIAKLEMGYQLKVQEAENLELTKRQAQQNLILRQRTLIAISMGLIAVLLILLVIRQYRTNKVKAELNRQLEDTVQKRTGDLEAANEQLRRSNDELERFTFIASHDLKEPLRNITSFVNLIQRKLGKSADQDLQDYMGFVTRNTKQLYALVEDILTHSRVRQGEADAPGTVELDEILQDIRSNLTHILEERSAQIVWSDLPSLIGHRSDFYLLFKNLIENGLKYNESSAPLIQVIAKSEAEDWCFSCKDNGLGIAPAYHKQIFQMFTRLNNRGKYLGSGIGLATCQQIVQKYSGELWVESEEGKGSTFHFRLPRRVVEVEMEQA
ncbi:MAG: tetratricopeptide repeat protein [Saprospiraceae bacterium]|nr:tetratricopeptide repeat protein [Saprospiraceae bacterium]